MSKVLSVHVDIVIPTEDLEGHMGAVRHAIRMKFSTIGEDVIRYVENNRAVKPKKEWIN